MLWKLRKGINTFDSRFARFCFKSWYQSRALFLTHYKPMSHFCTPWKHQKTKGFLTFSWGIEMEHCLKMDGTRWVKMSYKNSKWCAFMKWFSSQNNHLKSESHLKKLFYLLQWKPFKNDEKWFLFHLKSSFRSQDI